MSLLLALAVAGAIQAAARHELKLSNDTSGKPNVDVPVTLSLSSTSDIQGFVAEAEWNNTLPVGKLSVSSTNMAKPLFDTADVVVVRTGYDPGTKVGFIVIGVVMDSDGIDNEIIPASGAAYTTLATVNMKWELGGADVLPDNFSEQTIPLKFVDGKYGTAETGEVPLDNIVVVGGLSIGKVEGLILTDGAVKLVAPPPASLTIVNASGKFGEVVSVPIQLDSRSAVQGFTLSIAHKASEVKLEDIVLGPDTTTAEFFQKEIFPTGASTGGTFGVIMDFVDPAGTPPPIPAGTHRIAYYKYSSLVEIKTEADCSHADQVSNLEFKDKVFGDPLKENVIVIVGQSKNPTLENGKITFSVDQTKPPCVHDGGLLFAFATGGCELVDDPASADKDIHKPSDIQVTAGTAANPGKFQVGLWYRNPPNPYATDEGSNELEHIQGLSMALQFDPKCITCDGTYSLAGTITEAVGAEFVNIMCENREDDVSSDDTAGVDPGELIVAILADAVAPFDGKDLPPTADYLKLVCVDFHVTSPDNACTQCQNIVLHFPKYPDGADVIGPNGVESPVIRNMATIRKRYETSPGVWTTVQESVLPKQYVDGKVVLMKEPSFVRGDCNWSQYVRDDAHTQFAVDISDAAAVISYLFYTDTWQWHPPCLDACDANDDGRVDLADSVFILRYLFKFDRRPPAPFPEPGIDPSPDHLECTGGGACQ